MKNKGARGVLALLRGQTLMEFLLLVTIVVAAMVALLPRIKRSTQSMIKSEADLIGNQQGAEQDFNSASGYMESSDSTSNVVAKHDREDFAGTISQTLNENVGSTTRTNTFMGIFKE